MSPFIQLRNLSRSFQEGGRAQAVLRQVSLDIREGEKVALLGRSGSGKSTLLNLVSGIDRPDSGSVIVDGVDLCALSEHERTLFRRRNIGFVYQFFNLVPSLTAHENIEFVLELNGVAAAEGAARAAAMLERVGLAGRGHSFPSRLSGGEQQRVAIARAVVHRPRVVLADEPTGNLDARSGAAMLELLNELAATQGSALLLVTHSLAVARTADRIVTLEDGVLVERNAEFAW